MNRRAFFESVAAAATAQVVGKAVPSTVESYRYLVLSQSLGTLSYYVDGELVDVAMSFRFPQLIHTSTPST